MTSHTTLVIDKESARLQFLDNDGRVSQTAPDGASLLLDYMRPHNQVPCSMESGSPVKRLPLAAIIPTPLVAQMETGSVADYGTSQGFYHKDCVPSESTMALWMQIKDKSLQFHEFVYGGPDLDVKFTMDRLLGKDGKHAGSPKLEIHLVQPATGFKFRRNTHVSDWKPIQEMFADSLSTPGAIVDWTEGPTVYCR